MFKKYLLILPLLINVAFAAIFSDVGSDHKYADGIQYLKDQKIVEGYDDGTYKPANSINRAEALKIIMLSTKVELEEASDCFADVPLDQWYNSYVCTAKKLGLVKGYEGNLFKPAQNISRAEALKIAMEAMQIEEKSTFENTFFDNKMDNWFFAYVVTADNLDLLPFKRALLPNKAINRGELAEIFYRVLTSDDLNPEVPQAEAAEITPEVEPNVDPESASEPEVEVQPDVAQGPVVASDFFDNIELPENFDNTWHKSYMKKVTGKVTNGATKVFVAFEAADGSLTKSEVVVVNGSFEADVLVPDANSSKFTIYPNGSNTAKLLPITISDLSLIADRLEELNLDFGFDGRPYVNVTGNVPGAFELRFIANKTVSIKLKSAGKYYVSSAWFEGFDEGEMDVELISNLGVAKTLKLDVVENHYSDINEATNIDLPYTYTQGQNLQLTGTTSATLSDDLFVIMPNGLVEKVNDGVSINGANFSVNYSLADSGVYFIEINNESGFAEVNHPIYIEGLWPVIPDFRASNSFQAISNFNLQQTIDESLTLVNAYRTKYGLDPVTIDATLNQLAQYHSDNMVNNDFVGHVDHNSEGPNDRRTRFNITSFVGENLTYNNFGGVLAANQLLMRSAIHRKNILNPDWTSVGFGATLDADNALHYVQEFSYDATLAFNEFDQGISLAYPAINSNQALLDALDAWVVIMKEKNRYEVSIDGQSLLDLLPNDLGFTSYRVTMNVFAYPSSLLESLEDLNLNNTVVYRSVQAEDGKLYTIFVTAS